MTKAQNSNRDEATPSMFEPAELDSGRRSGTVEQACRVAVEAAGLDDRDAGLAAGYQACGRAVDIAVTRSDPYGVATALRELREAGARLGLDPASREGKGTGEVEAFLAGLSAT